MADTAPCADAAERAALGFLIDHLNRGCEHIHIDALELFLAGHGACQRTVAIGKRFVELGILKNPPADPRPFARDECNMSQAEFDRLADWASRRELPKVWEITGRSIDVQHSIRQAENGGRTADAATHLATRESEPEEENKGAVTNPTPPLEKPKTDSAPDWIGLGEAKRAILTVLKKATKRLIYREIAIQAGYTPDTLRQHTGALRKWKYIDHARGGFAITLTGAALMQC